MAGRFLRYSYGRSSSRGSPPSGKDWLQVERLEIQTSSDVWIKLTVMDDRDWNASLYERFKTDAQGNVLEVNELPAKLVKPLGE
jgi:hypothetical protein